MSHTPSKVSMELSKRIKVLEIDLSQTVSMAAGAVASVAINRIEHGPKTGHIYDAHDQERMVPTFNVSNQSKKFTLMVERAAPEGHVNGTHQSSAPGESPATWTGRLASNIFSTFVSMFKSKVSAIMPYAKELEYGRMRVAARPYMRPAIKEVRPKFRQAVRSAFERLNK